jgi:hypothetical protein
MEVGAMGQGGFRKDGRVRHNYDSIYRAACRFRVPPQGFVFEG